jgi:hypothetical protein
MLAALTLSACGQRHSARLRGDGDDATPAPLAHPVDHRTRAVQGAVEVEADEGLPVLDRHLAEDPLEGLLRDLRVPLVRRRGDHDRARKALFAEIVVDVQNPTAPIFGAARCNEGSHDLGGVIARLREIIYYGAEAIDQNLLCAGAVEVHLGHVQSSSNRTGRNEMSSSLLSWTGRPKDRNEEAVRI